MKTIKFLSLLMFVALSAGFASCSDDDDFEAADLVGTWESTWSEGWYKDTEYPDDNEEWNEATTGKDVMVVMFNADGKGVDAAGDTFSWSLDGDKLTLVYSGKYAYTSVGKVLKLTDKELVVETSETEGSESSYEKTTFKRK